MTLITNKREAALAVMFSQHGQPYIWGGNSELEDGGVDCSGSVNFALKEVGLTVRDHTSRDLAAMFPEVHELRDGVLVFFKRGSRIGHVEMVVGRLDGEWFTIGASGGGSSTDTIEEAREANARVKLHPIEHGWVKIVDPFPQEAE